MRKKRLHRCVRKNCRLPRADRIVSELNAQARLADLRVMTKDAHSLSAKWLVDKPEDMLKPTGLPDADLYWVAHAVVGTRGYELLDGLPDTKDYDYCVWKGVDPMLHPYGACYHDIGEKLSTGLIEWLRDRQVHTVIVGGLATDYCVKATVLQLLRAGGWQVWVNDAACRGIDVQTVEQAWVEMLAAGARRFGNADEISKYINNQ